VTEHALDHIGVDAELRGDRADAPVLAVVQSRDVDLGLLGYPGLESATAVSATGAAD
jgi:hypothetical protein